MLGKLSPQAKLFSADNQYLKFVGETSFYGFLAKAGRELFQDEDFAALYCLDNGRSSVPPSLLARALLLQTYDRVSDEEAKGRADFDLRWKVALGIEIDTRPFAKSTLQLFRAQLVIHEQAQALFRRSLSYARKLGYLKGRRMRAALDSSHILGRGAVEDTYNLIAEGIRTLSRELAQVQNEEWEAWLAANELSRYAAASIKGGSEVNWDKPRSREAFLRGLLADGGRLLEIARQVRTELEAESGADQAIAQGAELLTKLLWQDVEPTGRGYRIKEGTARDRIPSVHDPEQRHGHKSHGKTFTGHKAAVAVDVESQLITAVEVIAGNESDGKSAACLVEQSEENTDAEVAQVIGDTAYGSMEVRQDLGEREVIAPTVNPTSGRGIPKSDFAIDVANDLVRCPMGAETQDWRWVWTKLSSGAKEQVKRFAFDKETCRACARFAECVKDQRRRGRFITLHPQEEALQQARAREATDYFREQYRDRVVVEHRIARLMGLGMRQARYFGRAKTRFQLFLAAAVANLTLVAGKTGLMKGKAGEKPLLSKLLAAWLALKRSPASLARLLRRRGPSPEERQASFRPASRPYLLPFKTWGFRPGL
jgi:hypothetical protein